MNALPKKTALIVIDVQKGFDDPSWGARNNLEAEENIARLLDAWRKSQRPIFHVQHFSANADSPLHPDSPGNAIKDIVKPLDGEPVIQKRVNSAFIGTNLEQMLRENDIKTLVIAGLTTPHCVSTTTRMAGNLGFDVYLVSDATAAFEISGPTGRRFSAEEMHATALASLHEEFAAVIETETILANA